jgi:hypothetical protein
MSAHLIDLGPAVSAASVEVDQREAEVAEDNSNIVSRIRFEILYQLYFAPEPTREQIAMEEFLLECD